MGESEQKAFELLKKNRRIHRPVIEKFNGRWLKEIGDGVLASFNSVSDAVYCAATIQKSCEQHPDLNLRIGIHLGEVVFEDNDVHGDGVNIASRLEPLAPIGGILVSESVHKNLLNKDDVKTDFQSEERLKNVREPVKTYQVSVGGTESFNYELHKQDLDPGTTSALNKKLIYASVAVILVGLVVYFMDILPLDKQEATEERIGSMDKSVVVLPFADMSAHQDQEYFSDGMMEEIINHLVKIQDVKVISRTTSMNYKGTNKNAKEIASELNVATVLEGSVRKEGDQVRITVQLIEGVADTHLFSETYDRQLTNIFQVQSEVAQLVAEALKAQISPEEKIRLDRVPTENTLAYELYLKAGEQSSKFWSTFDDSHIYNSIELLNQAIALDPDFSDAYTRLGTAYWELAHFSPDYDPIQWELSKANLQKAIELDPGNGRAYAELAVVQHNWDWDSAAALKSFKKALALSPTDPSVHNHLQVFYNRIKDCDHADKAARIRDSLRNIEYHPKLNMDVLVCHRDLDGISKLNADNYWIDVLMFQGRYEEVIAQLEDSALAKGNLTPLVQLGEAYALSGDTLNALKIIDRLTELSKNQYVPSCIIAPIYMALGDDEKAYMLIEQGLKQREIYVHVLDRYFYSIYRIQDDPRFLSIVERRWIPQE